MQPDLFVLQCLHPHVGAAAHAGRQGVPWIFTMHLTSPMTGASQKPSSRQSKRQQRLPATNRRVIPCGITLPTAQASFSDQPFRVVYCGRMVERQKCIHRLVHTLIQAWRMSSQMKPT